MTKFSVNGVFIRDNPLHLILISEAAACFFVFLYRNISQLLFNDFIKVYIVMASLKRHKKTSLVALFSFSRQHWSENEEHTFLLTLHNCQFILRTTVNFIYSNMKWFFIQKLLAVQQLLYRFTFSWSRRLTPITFWRPRASFTFSWSPNLELHFHAPCTKN